jgi:hypothetical protein
MTSTPPTSLPDLAVLVEKQNTMQHQLHTKMAQVTAPAGTQLRFEEEAEFGQPPEVSTGMSGLRFSGGGEKEDGTDFIVLSPDDDFCLGLIARDRVCLQRRDLCDIAKHCRKKLQVNTEAFHILDLANGQRKVSAFKEPSIQVQGLSAKQMQALTMERHSVQEWHRLFTALCVVRLKGDDEFEDVKRRATKKLTIEADFIPNKRAKVRDESLPLSVPPTVLFRIDSEERQQLQAVSLAPGEEDFAFPPSSGMLCAHILLPLILNCPCCIVI